MDDFGKFVEDCRKNNKETMIDNAARDHALVLFRNLIKAASGDRKGGKIEPIRIVSGSLCSSFFAELVNDIKSYLANDDAKIDLVVLDDSELNDQNAFYAELKSSGDKTSIHVADSRAGIEDFPHFILVGDSRFRYETDHNHVKAKASFNNPDIGNTLLGMFNDLVAYLLKPLPQRELPLEQGCA